MSINFILLPSPLMIVTLFFGTPKWRLNIPISSILALPSFGGDFTRTENSRSPVFSTEATLEFGFIFTEMRNLLPLPGLRLTCFREIFYDFKGLT